jgi:hypothetical protein
MRAAGGSLPSHGWFSCLLLSSIGKEKGRVTANGKQKTTKKPSVGRKRQKNKTKRQIKGSGKRKDVKKT